MDLAALIAKWEHDLLEIALRVVKPSMPLDQVQFERGRYRELSDRVDQLQKLETAQRAPEPDVQEERSTTVSKPTKLPARRARPWGGR